MPNVTRLIDVEYEELPAVFDPLAAMQSSAPTLHPHMASYQGLPQPVATVHNVCLHIRAGEVHAVIGSSGAGKTTLAKHLAGLLKPTAGQVVVCGSETRERRVADLALTVGTVLQNPDEQISEGTVWEEISFPLRQRQYERTGLFSKRQRYTNDYIQDRVSSACELVGIEPELLERDPILLPRGQRKLVTIAEALVMDPQVLVLDEPIISLGAAARRQIIHMLARLRDLGKAVFLAENNVDFVSEVANTVTVLNRGRVVLQGQEFSGQSRGDQPWKKPEPTRRQVLSAKLVLPLKTALSAACGVSTTLKRRWCTWCGIRYRRRCGPQEG